MCHPFVCVCETWKWYLIKHICVTKGVFSDYNGQLHVSACTGHLRVVLGEINLRYFYKHIVRTWCRDLYVRASAQLQNHHTSQAHLHKVALLFANKARK